jgi:hypothetical protein
VIEVSYKPQGPHQSPLCDQQMRAECLLLGVMKLKLSTISQSRSGQHSVYDAQCILPHQFSFLGKPRLKPLRVMKSHTLMVSCWFGSRNESITFLNWPKWDQTGPECSSSRDCRSPHIHMSQLLIMSAPYLSRFSPSYSRLDK